MAQTQVFSITVLYLLSQLFHQSVCQCTAGGSEESISGWKLQRHTYKTMKAKLGHECLFVCRQEDRCQSFNFVMSVGMCEFNNRTKEARPENFVSDPDRYYFRRDIKRVPLGSIPELPAESCKEIKASEGQVTSGKYWMSTVKPGMSVLAHCDMETEDIDECTASSPVCDANALCNNTLGSYGCRCKLGYSGNGKTCRDIDECSASSPVCDANATCENTLGSYGCKCKPGYYGDGKRCRVYPKNCAELYHAAKTTSGVYKIDPDGLGEFEVFCDQTTAGGGWTVFQKRFNSSVDFYRGWDDYKQGFGNPTGEFWLGLDKIHRLTVSSRNRLRVDLEDLEENTAFANYSSFAVTSERAKYRLSLGSYSGTAGDALSYHRGSAFSTKDRDNDESAGNCAGSYKGAWWYKVCHHSNLNGLYLHGQVNAQGMSWHHWKNSHYSVIRSEMKIRPKDF